MKKWILASVLCITAAASQAQDMHQSQVPSVVVNTFLQFYKNATDVEWEKKGDLYEVEFEVNKKDHELRIDAAGKILRHKAELNLTEVPQAVLQQLKTQFAGFRVKDPKKIEENNQVIYRVEVKRDHEERDLELSPEGKVLTNRLD